MKLYAISDLHLANNLNRRAFYDLTAHPEDWLILAGDIGETKELLEFAFEILLKNFKHIVWVPGNHDLWTIPINDGLRGESKYNELVSLCRQFGVFTPEDDFQTVLVNDQTYIVAPTFTLYDYSFRPQWVPIEKAVEWAAEDGIVCTDEDLLLSTPYNSFFEWCDKRCNYTESRLNSLPLDIPIIYVNHYPSLVDHAQLNLFPRFKIWCGTKRTEEWLNKYNIKIVIYGHMHMRSTKYLNGIRFEEVSLGYPRDWDETKHIDLYLKEIL